MSMDITQIKVKPIVWAKQLHLGGVSSYHGDPNGREPNFVNGYGSHDYEIGEFTDGRYKSEFWYRGKGFLLETGIQDLDRAKEICQQHKESRAKELMGLVELTPAPTYDTLIASMVLRMNHMRCLADAIPFNSNSEAIKKEMDDLLAEIKSVWGGKKIVVENSG